MSAGYQLARSAFHRHVDDDEKVSIKLLRELDAAHHAQASLVEAFIRLKHDRKFKDPDAILAAFRKAGELGVPYGSFYAGLCYANGYGTRKNRRTAERRYRDGAEQGCISALFALGKMYRRGEGVDPDIPLALQFFERAAGARVPYPGPDARGQCDTILDLVHSHEKDVKLLAMEQLGELYWDESFGVPQDIAQARYWLRRAADAGSPDAKRHLRKLPPAPPPRKTVVPGPQPMPIRDEGIKLNDMDSAEAYLLGQMHAGAPHPDYKLAARHFHIAEQLGHRDAKREGEAIKAAVGERAYGLFFAGWNATCRP
jgi:TPR repeat protein